MNPIAVRRWLNRLAQLFLLLRGDADEPARIGARRASGECVCPTCMQPYRMHAADPFAPWLEVLCDGTRVKL